MAWKHLGRWRHFPPDYSATPTAGYTPVAYGSALLDGWVSYRPSGTDVAVADGGTGSSTASGAGTALGLAIGSDVHPYDAGLASLAGVDTASNLLPYTTGANAWTTTSITSAGRALIDDTNATAQRSTLGLGTIATQASSAVTITGGAISGVTASQASQTLTDGATINWNMANGHVAVVTLGGNRTLAAPTNLTAGATGTLAVIQDGAGSRQLTWSAAYKFPGCGARAQHGSWTEGRFHLEHGRHQRQRPIVCDRRAIVANVRR